MTLLRDVNFSDIFSDIRKKMNIQNKHIINKNFGEISFNIANWETINISGITITPSNKDFHVNEFGEIFFKETKVLLYIRDQAIYNLPTEMISSYKSTYKFHIAWCSTLQGMFNNHKYDKYVVSTRQDENLLVRCIGSNNKILYQGEQKLQVCKNCLKTLNYQGYKFANLRKQAEIFNNFQLKDFFSVNNSDYSFHVMPKYDEFTAPLNVYPKNWEQIATTYKKLCNYKCQRCHRDFSKTPSLLHVHHINGYKTDIQYSNLIALCTDCHLKEHPHMWGLYKNK